MDEKKSSSDGVFSVSKAVPHRQKMAYGRYLWWMLLQPQQLQTYLKHADELQQQQLMVLGNWCLGLIIWLPLLVTTGVIGLSDLSYFAPGSILILLIAFSVAIWLTGQDHQIAHALSSNVMVQVGITAVLAGFLLIVMFVEPGTVDLMIVGPALFALLLSTIATAVLAAFTFSMMRNPIALILFAWVGALILLFFNVARVPLLFLTLVFSAGVLTTYLSQMHQQARIENKSFPTM